MENSNNISQELLETIERYLNDAMDANDRLSFEKKMQESSVLRQQVVETEMLVSGIKKAVLKNKLDSIHTNLLQNNNTKKETTKVFKLNFRSLSIAATVLILAGGFWMKYQQSSSDTLFNQYFKADRGLVTTMSASDNYDFNDAMVDYKNAKYDLAIQKWEVLLESKTENDTLNYFLGVAYLANKSEAKAISYLKKVVSQDQNQFTSDSYYYLGLAYLKADNEKLAIDNLKKSNSPSSDSIISELSD